MDGPKSWNIKKLCSSKAMPKAGENNLRRFYPSYAVNLYKFLKCTIFTYISFWLNILMKREQNRLRTMHQYYIYAMRQPTFLPYWRFNACISIHFVILFAIGFHTIGKASFSAETRRSKASQSTAGSGSSRTGTFRLTQVDGSEVSSRQQLDSQSLTRICAQKNAC